MRKLNAEEIKKCSFEVLCELKNVFDKYELTYSLSGGTLLGAIRHNGFIPWDDDIDIMMPREDYNKFIKIFKRNEMPFNLLSQEILGSRYCYAFAKACNKKTLLIEEETMNDVKLGVYVDIFPIDGMGNNMTVAKVRNVFFQLLRGIRLSSSWKKYRKSKIRKWYYEPLRYVCYLVSRIISAKELDVLIQKHTLKYDFLQSNFAGRIVGDYGKKEIMEKSIFESFIKHKFEDQEFSVIEKHDVFLKSIYGNYMDLPPVEKRTTHHTFTAYYIES